MRIPIAYLGDEEVAWLHEGNRVEQDFEGGKMSTCVRGGVSYKRHHWKKDTLTCVHCGRKQGGDKNNVIGDQESKIEERIGDSGVARNDDGNVLSVSTGLGCLPMSTGDGGEGDDVERMEGEGGGQGR